MDYSSLKEKSIMIGNNDLDLKKYFINDNALKGMPDFLLINKDVIRFLKSNSYLTINEIGYDALRKVFYMDSTITTKANKNSSENYLRNNLITFDNFDDYYNNLDGNIYEKACYFGFTFSDELVSKYNIDLSKINYESRITESMADLNQEIEQDDKLTYKEGERKKAKIKKWVEKINNADTFEDFDKIMKSIERSENWIALLLNIIINQLDETKLNFLFEHINNSNYVRYENYAYYLAFYKKGLDYFENGTQTNLYKYKKYKAKYIKFLIPYQKNNDMILTKGFSPKIHYFYVKRKIYDNYDSLLLFETFDEFAKYLGNDLSGCDLSAYNKSSIDFNLYKTNSKTRLPMNDEVEYKIKVKKEYDPNADKFVVEQVLIDNNSNIIKKASKDFKRFADFIKYINYDLTGANLIFCNDLVNVPDLYKYNIDKAMVRSDILIKNNIEYEVVSLKYQDYDKTIQTNNEDSSLELYSYNIELLVNEVNTMDRKIYYISDLHLGSRLAKENARNEADVIYVFNNLAKELTKYYESIVIIPGDVSGDISLFKKFLKILSKNVKRNGDGQQFIFTLGNHELWAYKNQSIDYIVNEYRMLIESYGFYLLHNELMCFKDGKWNYYNEKIIFSEEFENIVKTSINTSRILLFGGIGFAGNNKTFNANNFIYMNTINRSQEVKESSHFEEIYNKIVKFLGDYNVIVATHMPLSDWSNQEYHTNFIYLSGHTHKNYFYDDGEIRVYSDNQVGYKAKTYKLKYFYLDDSFDELKYFEDGIYPITQEQYKDFYYGKRIGMTLNRNLTGIFVIKKHGYYMFVHETNKSLCILNGGSLKKLPINSKEYYFENIEEAIRMMKKPLDEYTKIQKEVADSIKRFGGTGRIHGAIVDISFFCHVYVNPFDLKLTYYYALDTIDKTIYKSLSDLLNKHEKKLYVSYSKMIQNGSKFEIERYNSVDFIGKSAKYYDTDIYVASRKIKQMQKLDDNIIAIWVELASSKDYQDNQIDNATDKIEFNGSIAILDKKKKYK